MMMNDWLRWSGRVWVALLLFFPVVVLSGEGYTIVNAGVSGNNSRHLLGRLEADVLGKDPALVIIGVGTNDAINSKSAVPLKIFEDHLAKLAMSIRAGGAKVLFLTPPPCHGLYVMGRHPASFFGSVSPSEKIALYREAIIRFCEGAGIPVVDIYWLFKEAGKVGELKDSWIRNQLNSGVKDGVHPTPVGYRMMAGAIASEVRRLGLAPGATIVCFGDSITYGAGAKGPGTVTGESYPASLQRALATEVKEH